MSENRKYADRRDYLIKAVAKRRKRLKEMAIELKGGKCMFCGYKKTNTALDFHHIDGKTKEFGISLDGITRSWQRITKELEKCVLVCANCHREIHAGILQLSEVIQKENGVNSGKPKKGNPDPSPTNGLKVVGKVQRLRVRSQSNKLYSAPHP